MIDEHGTRVTQGVESITFKNVCEPFVLFFGIEAPELQRGRKRDQSGSEQGTHAPNKKQDVISLPLTELALMMDLNKSILFLKGSMRVAST